MEYTYFTLPNGIRCIHKQVKSPVSYCGLTVGTGSRDELSDEYGMAHFIEHALFKGTHKRKAYHINNRLDNLGGELNAYTTKEETVVHATTLKADFPKAVELIADIFFNSIFPEKELCKERDIIIDEINSYKDTPSEQIYDDFEDLLFAESSLGHNILGYKRSLMHYGGDQIRHFLTRTYNTDQMIFSSVGNSCEKKFEEICTRYFGEIPSNLRTFERDTAPDCLPFSKTVAKGTFQTHCILGNRACGSHGDRRAATALLVNMLGGPSANSILNVSVREKHGLSYNIEAGYTPYNETGIASIYFGTDKNHLDRCLELVHAELQKVREGGITPRQLSVAKKQFIGQLSISLDSNEGAMLGAGKSLLVYGEVDNMERITRKITNITRDDLIAVAGEVFCEDIPTLIYR